MPTARVGDMSWLHPQLHDPSLRDTYEEVRGLAGWSDWAAFLDATAVAPREPGVYLLRDADSGIIRCAQMAGARWCCGCPRWGCGTDEVHCRCPPIASNTRSDPQTGGRKDGAGDDHHGVAGGRVARAGGSPCRPDPRGR